MSTTLLTTVKLQHTEAPLLVRRHGSRTPRLVAVPLLMVVEVPQLSTLMLKGHVHSMAGLLVV